MPYSSPRIIDGWMFSDTEQQPQVAPNEEDMLAAVSRKVIFQCFCVLSKSPGSCWCPWVETFVQRLLSVSRFDWERDGAVARRVARRHRSPKLGAHDVVHRRGHRFHLRSDQRVGPDRQHHAHQNLLFCQIHPECAESLHVQPCAGRRFAAGDLRSCGCQPLPVREVAVRESGL